jgi:hypothetical protein
VSSVNRVVTGVRSVIVEITGCRVKLWTLGHRMRPRQLMLLSCRQRLAFRQTRSLIWMESQHPCVAGAVRVEPRLMKQRLKLQSNLAYAT